MRLWNIFTSGIVLHRPDKSAECVVLGICHIPVIPACQAVRIDSIHEYKCKRKLFIAPVSRLKNQYRGANVRHHSPDDPHAAH
jgi:hypothetical protein